MFLSDGVCLVNMGRKHFLEHGINSVSLCIFNNNNKFLNQILDEIQENLHSSGKQLMVKTFNNKTENIKFIQR